MDPDAAGKAALGLTRDHGIIQKLSIDTPRNDLILAINALIDLNNKHTVIGTANFAPSLISSNFTLTGTRYSKTTVGWSAITNASMTYTAGDTKEKLLLTIGAMANKPTSGNGEVALYVNGVIYGIQMYYSTNIAWYRGSAAQPPLELDAGETVTLALYAFSSDTAAFDITTETAKWKPTITGYSVYNGI